MSEWWTYEPKDLMMFAPETYYRLFELHNTAMWPAQLAALLAVLALLYLLARPRPFAGRVISVLLAAAWAFVAWSYFIERYASINLAAIAYAWLFAGQSLLLLISGVGLNRLSVAAGAAPRLAGMTLFIAGVAGYPLLAGLFGRPWLQAELFAFAPDPTVFATFGILAAAARPCWELWVVPAIWCAITAATLWTMGAPEALLILSAPALALGLVVYRGTAKSSARTHEVNG